MFHWQCFEWALRNYPTGEAFVQAFLPRSLDAMSELTEVVNEGRIVTPFRKESVAMKPGTTGGANWPPGSYNPRTQQLYVCATDHCRRFGPGSAKRTSDKVVIMGGNCEQAPVDDRGLCGAIDLLTNTICVASRMAGNVPQRKYQ